MFEPKVGDPLVLQKKGHLKIDWTDVLQTDQLPRCTKKSQVNEHCGEEIGWTEIMEDIVDEAKGINLNLRWWDYQGKACKAGKAMPLVIMFQDFGATCWTQIADREGLALLSFECHRNLRNKGFAGALGFGPGDDEIEAFDIVIERTIEKFGCDRNRIFVSGHSYGDMIALVYASRHADRLAGLISMNGPTAPFNQRRYNMYADSMPTLPVLQIRADNDYTCDGFNAMKSFPDFRTRNKEWLRNIRSRSTICNRNLWAKADGLDIAHPVIQTERNRAYIRYTGEKANLTYAELHNTGHMNVIDNAEIMWENMVSLYARGENGTFVKVSEPKPADCCAAGLVCGYSRALINQQVTELSAPCLVLEPNLPLTDQKIQNAWFESEYASFYAPIDICDKFFGLDYTVTDKPKTLTKIVKDVMPEGFELKDSLVEFAFNGHDYRFYTNATLYEEDGRCRNMLRPMLYINGALMIPVVQFAKVLGFTASEYNDAVYITDHDFELGYTLSRLLREEILADEIVTPVYTVKTYPCENGTFTLSADKLNEGDELRIYTHPAPGYKTKAVHLGINGVENALNKMGDEEYLTCNAMGEMEVAVEFEKE